MAIYQCFYCEQMVDDDKHPMKVFAGNACCPSCYENLPEDFIQAGKSLDVLERQLNEFKQWLKDRPII